jgi:LemA protein
LIISLATTGGGDAVIQDVTRTLNQPGEYGVMNRTLSGALAIALLLGIPILLWAWLHNSLVRKEERVFEAWAQTESNFQRRADLVPALVDTVSRYLKHESTTLVQVTQERSAAQKQLAGAVEELLRAEKQSSELRKEERPIIEDEARLQALLETEQRLRDRMNAIFAIAESYPELKASDQFLELQAQLEGTENRINVARMRFNEAVRSYNASIRMLPSSLVASAGNFQRKAYFQSAEEARSAPALAFE